MQVKRFQEKVNTIFNDCSIVTNHDNRMNPFEKR